MLLGFLSRRDFLLCYKESASRVIRQYHYTGWPDIGSPDSGTGLIDLIGQVQRWQQQCGDTTVAVHCRHVSTVRFSNLVSI